MSTAPGAKTESSTMVRADIVPTMTRVFSPALSQMMISKLSAVPTNAPLAGLRAGSLFLDRTDPNLLWYAPVYAIAQDPDSAFAFSATQTGHDDQGHPFFAGSLTLSVTKSIPADVPGFKVKFPAAVTREIPVNGLTPSLTTSFLDTNGNAQVRVQEGRITAGTGDSFLLTFENVLGGAVISLYEDLVMFGKASVVISGTYDLWQEILHPEQVGPPRPAPPIAHGPLQLFTPVSHPTVLLHPALSAGSFRAASMLSSSSRVEFNPGLVKTATPLSSPLSSVTSIRVSNSPTRITPDPTYERITVPLLFKFDLGKKYAANSYSLMFTVSDGAANRPIINVSDLRDFNVRQSEFKELTALGDISQRFLSISRAYIGVLSKTVLIIPTRYVIARTATALECECLALLDSTAAGGSKCKFQFSILIVPDVSAIDLLQFTQEVSSTPILQGYTVKLPTALRDGGTAKLQTAFASTIDCAQTSAQNAFSLAIQVRDDEGSPAVASANLLIRQLCTDQEPLLTGAVSLKLDDFYPDPVEATVTLNFHESVGAADELDFTPNEAAQTVDVVNRSSFDLHFSRYAISSTSAISITKVDQTVQASTIFQAPLPADHTALAILVDRKTAFTGAVAKSDIGPLMKFESQDVQDTQYMIGVNATPVDFGARGISRIDVSTVFVELPDVAVPTFPLVDMRKLNQTNVTIPIQVAVSHLNATLKFTLHHIDPQRADASFTLQHEFVDQPILILNDTDLNAAQLG
jgi:hypothetical protein